MLYPTELDLFISVCFSGGFNGKRPATVRFTLVSICDSWDAEEPKPKPQPVAPAPEKLTLAERLRLKEEKRRKEKEEKLKREEELRAEQSMTELQRERLAEEAELGLLQDTFGAAPVVPDTKNSIDACEPRTKEDFNVLNDLLQAKLRKIEKSPHYSAFAEKLIRDAMTEVDVDALKSLSTAITALVTEKQKLVKGKIKKKGKGKLLVERENDYNFQEDNIEPDEYDDFM
ncbi:translation initiation factor eIF3 subunit [Opisthorchis viverrini]|uniref:Translation initiation factor eIF3 subunit n=1 Tax=Opisthorchis viverrini TaxID=6198 RepID=A0A1S8WHQ2_OPIVI|nr:translation initiation factor eIF3 subunit [Opisthorchis viverrini]